MSNEAGLGIPEGQPSPFPKDSVPSWRLTIRSETVSRPAGDDVAWNSRYLSH